MFVLLNRGKPPSGPSVTASCLSTLQDSPDTHTHQLPLRWAPCYGPIAAHLPRVVGKNPTLNSPLFFWICDSNRGRNTCRGRAVPGWDHGWIGSGAKRRQRRLVSHQSQHVTQLSASWIHSFSQSNSHLFSVNTPFVSSARSAFMHLSFHIRSSINGRKREREREKKD